MSPGKSISAWELGPETQNLDLWGEMPKFPKSVMRNHAKQDYDILVPGPMSFTCWEHSTITVADLRHCSVLVGYHKVWPIWRLSCVPERLFDSSPYAADM